jgi:hypothetical protein
MLGFAPDATLFIAAVAALCRLEQRFFQRAVQQATKSAQH